MNLKSIYIILSVTAIFGLASCNKSRLPDLRESFSYKDNNPFGSSVAYHILTNTYPQQEVQFVTKNFSENYQWDYDTSSLYVNISQNFFMSDRDVQSMLDFTYKGNTAFIASAYIDTILLQKMDSTELNNMAVSDQNSPADYNDTHTDFTKEFARPADNFSYFYYPFKYYFADTGAVRSHSLALDISGRPNFRVFFWGKGRIFILCEPRALSNYFLLTGDNYLYMQRLMQLLPAAPESVYWDDIHLKRNYRQSSGSFSTLGTLLKNPPLAHAFFILLLLLLFYIFFNSKRRQRIIPIIKPVENTSVAFTEAIAGLYIGKKDNKLISEKMITYFNEHVRSKYLVHMNINDEAYADMLSRKSGVSPDTVTELVKDMKNTSGMRTVSDQQLFLLNGLIEKFYKNKI